MNNELQSAEQNQTKTPELIGPDKALFKEIIQAANLPAEKVKQELPNLDKIAKSDRVEPVKTATDEQKIKLYDDWDIKHLPFDWKLQLDRLKTLEENQADYLEKKEELKGWTETFGEKKPLEAQAEIKELEEKTKQIEEELNAKITILEANLSTQKQEKQTILTNSEQKIKDLASELKQWGQVFGNREIEEVKEEWEVLKQRPDLPFSEKEFMEDYASRKTLQQSKLESEELEQEKQKVIEWKEKTQKLWWKVGEYLAQERKRKYTSAPPIFNFTQAQKAIAELLEETENNWTGYFDKKPTSKGSILNLSLFWNDKENQARQILEWITEVRTTLDYQTLFERWSGGKWSNQESRKDIIETYDFDGSLFLFIKYLEVKRVDTEIIETTEIPNKLPE